MDTQTIAAWLKAIESDFMLPDPDVLISDLSAAATESGRQLGTLKKVVKSLGKDRERREITIRNDKSVSGKIKTNNSLFAKRTVLGKHDVVTVSGVYIASRISTGYVRRMVVRTKVGCRI